MTEYSADPNQHDKVYEADYLGVVQENSRILAVIVDSGSTKLIEIDPRTEPIKGNIKFLSEG